VTSGPMPSPARIAIFNFMLGPFICYVRPLFCKWLRFFRELCQPHQELVSLDVKFISVVFEF